MCNLYSEDQGLAAIRALFRTAHDRTGNLPLLPGIFPTVCADRAQLRRGPRAHHGSLERLTPRGGPVCDSGAMILST